MTGADILLKSLKKEGVEVIFGYPGGVVIPIHDLLEKYGIRHILPRNEQGAAMAADGYFRVTGKVGVCLATSGPGATNLVTGIANAYMDSVGMVAITGQVATKVCGTDAFQEVNMMSLTKDITKKNYFVKDVRDVAKTVREAFYLARSGRPRPVHIDLPVDVLKAVVEKFEYPRTTEAEKNKPRKKESKKNIAKALAMIENSEKPMIIAGHGIVLSGASDEFKKFAEKWDIPMTQTLLGMGILPDRHPLNLRMAGMHGMAYANRALHSADLIIAIGTRFSDRVTGRLEEFAKKCKVIHVEIDKKEIGKNVKPDLALLGDCKEILAQINAVAENKAVAKNAWAREQWVKWISEWRRQVCLSNIKLETAKSGSGKVMPFEVIEEISKQSGKDAIIVSDVGQNQMWTAHYFRYNFPGQLLSSGGLGCMGYSLPAAIGAQIARPKKQVWSLMGDGGFQMNMQELGAVMENKLPLKIIILSNGYLGMVRQWQELFYNKNYAATRLVNPDFVALAKAYGIEAYRVEKPGEVKKMIGKAAKSEKAILLDFAIDPEANVFPMVPPGEALSQTKVRKKDIC